MKIFTTIRNNWKKSLAGAVILGFSSNYAYTSYKIHEHMYKVCNELKQQSYINQPLKHVVVIVNPTAYKKKSEQLFKQYCEPLLHLAGYSVEIWKTNYVGHAKTLVEEMTHLPDGIVVAGGDGTCSEVVTGLMRRDHRQCPLAFLPLGTKSETALRFLSGTNLEDDILSNKYRHIVGLTDAILQMVHGAPAAESVIKYDVIDSSTDSSGTELNLPKTEKTLKPIYGMSNFSWGLLRDIEAVKDKYWYFGGLRHHAAVIFSSLFQKFDGYFSTAYVSTPPCAGCRNCVSVDGASRQNANRSRNMSYLKGLLPKAHETNQQQIRNSRFNENCTTETKGSLNANQICIQTKSSEGTVKELEVQVLDSLNPGFNILKHTIEIVRNNMKPSNTLVGRTIRFMPSSFQQGMFYAIDGEEYDVRPIQITLLQDEIKVFRRGA